MKKIVYILGGVILVGLLVIGSLVFLVPSDFKVEKEITINVPKQKVFAYSRMLKNQNDWGPWVKKDPKIKQEYKGTDGEVGFVSSWDSDHESVGAGEQEIKKITGEERIDTEIRFKKPWESTSDAFMVFEEAGADKTKVKWGFTGSMPKPWNLMLLVMDMEAAVGGDFEEGLGSLKKILEEREAAKPVEPAEPAE